MLSASGPDGREETENGTDENGDSTSHKMVDRVRDPAGEESNGNVRASVDKAGDPLVSVAECRVDAELHGKGQVGAVRAGLIPALDGGSDGVENDGEVQNLGVVPAMLPFDCQALAVFFVELENRVKSTRALSNESTFLKKRKLVHQVSLFGELFHVGEKLVLGNANEWIADPREM